MITCDGGAELPVQWVYEGAEDCDWQRDRSHWPDALTPMDVWRRNAGWPGVDRAWEEAAMEPPAMFYRFQLAGPFLYVRANPYELKRLATIAARYHEVVRQYGNAMKFWQEHGEPRIQAASRGLAATSTDKPLRASAELWAYGFSQTFTAQSLLGEANLRLIALLGPIAGDDAMLRSLEVTQGGENASQTIDTEIWELAELGRQTLAVANTLNSDAADVLASLRREPTAAKFVAAFDALVDRHGSRSQGWDLALPTWSERPDAPLSLVRAQLRSANASPAAQTARSIVFRREATERALAQLTPEKHEEFAKIVAEMDGYVSVREGRAYWQMVITGEMRALLLRKGAVLVRDGSIDRAEDILFLVPDDFEGQPASDLRALVTERRREWKRWCEVTPPAAIGKPAAAPTAAALPPPDQLRGAPASRGDATGPARIIRAPEEAARLQSGDILVCVMTTPAWTPLFGIAAGIITETGGALSHPAITAREYGIPAVVAVQGATTRIREGQIVTIDGGAGTVTLAE